MDEGQAQDTATKTEPAYQQRNVALVSLSSFLENHLFTTPSIHLQYLSFHSFIHPSINPSVNLLNHQSIHTSASPSINRTVILPTPAHFPIASVSPNQRLHTPLNSPVMVVVHKSRHWADLHSVSVISWVFKEPIVRVEELSRDQKEELPRWSTVVQSKTKTHKDSVCSVCLQTHTTFIQTHPVGPYY